MSYIDIDVSKFSSLVIFTESFNNALECIGISFGNYININDNGAVIITCESFVVDTAVIYDTISKVQSININCWRFIWCISNKQIKKYTFAVNCSINNKNKFIDICIQHNYCIIRRAGCEAYIDLYKIIIGCVHNLPIYGFIVNSSNGIRIYNKHVRFNTEMADYIAQYIYEKIMESITIESIV